MANLSEKKLQSKIMEYLNSIEGIWVRSHTATAYTGRGHPDIYGCHRGRFFAFEVKIPGKKPTVIQAAELQKIILAGGCACLVTSVNDVKKVLA